MFRKGQGFIVMLSGPPGTGKTLTAEAGKNINVSVSHLLTLLVADVSKRPLYHIQAETLGTVSSVVSRNLRRAFQLCSEWDAVLLLDGARFILDWSNII
jgi:MoxR-like ATPase